MKLYTSMAPNPVRVALFLLEKGVSIPTVEVDILAGETRAAEFASINSLHELPVLELDDGTLLTESLAICQYLESRFPGPPLLGEGPEEQAKVRMWCRRVERQLFDKAGNYGIHTMPLFADKVTQVPEYAQSLTASLAESFLWLDKELADGRTYIAGETFTMADIIGMATLFILGITNLEIPQEAEHLHRWASTVTTRRSWLECTGDINSIKTEATKPQRSNA